MKNVPGRRTDWHECQWLQFLHSVGLLRAAFRPEGDVCGVRSLMRHRSDLVLMANQHIKQPVSKPAVLRYEEFLDYHTAVDLVSPREQPATSNLIGTAQSTSNTAAKS